MTSAALAEPETSGVALSAFQSRVLGTPEAYDLALMGGRGGGKSFCLALLALRHCEQLGQRARALFIRRSYVGLRDFESICYELFSAAYGTKARM